MITKKQKVALDTALSGKNMFLTGGAGTGKTYILKQICDELEKTGKMVALVASTGTAALNLMEATGYSAQTAHSLLGIPITDKEPLVIDGLEANYFSVNERKLEVLKSFDVFIFDEISMLRLDAFGRAMKILDKVDKARGKKCQRIVVGDFLQLPPVVTNDDLFMLQDYYYPSNMYAFDYTVYQWQNREDLNNLTIWKEQEFEIVNLEEIVRQSTFEFASFLNKVRFGDSSELNYVNAHANFCSTAPRDVVALYPLKREVERLNNERLNELVREGAPLETYKASTQGEVCAKDYDRIPEEMDLRVCVGAKVRTTVNSSDLSFSNGSTGTYLGMVERDGDQLMRIRLDRNEKIVEVGRHCREVLGDWRRSSVTSESGETRSVPKRDVIGKIFQFPVVLSWAMTIHKSQGYTLERAFVSPRSIFTDGQLYVALSRVKTIEGLYLNEKILGRMVMCNKRARSAMLQFIQRSL